jgi:hypothetical protein
MKIQKLLAAAPVLLMSAGAAYATSVYTIDESYTVTACTGTVCVTPPTVTTFTSTSKPTLSGDLGQNISLPTTGVQNFFTVFPASGLSGSITGTVQVDFTFTEYLNGVKIPGVTGSLVQDGTFQANYNGSLNCSSSSGQSDCLYWNPLGANLTPGDGSTYTGTGDSPHQSTTASVSDPVTLSNGASFKVNFFDAQDWDIVPGVSFTNIDPSPTPLPAALPLFTAGLSVMGLLGWRRKQKAASRNPR